MSREAYQVPTAAVPVPGRDDFGQSGQGNKVTFTYECGDCAAKVTLEPGGHIRCLECGHRILYKPRTKRLVQFEAR